MEPRAASANSPAARKKAEKAEKKLAKEKEKWQLYIDYLHRHITIVTSKYIIWEKNDFDLFKEAVEKAQRLDEKDQSNADTLAKLKLRLEILETKKYFSECNMFKKYFDFITRMRQLNLIAKDLIKVCKKAKLEPKPIEELERYFNVWKDLVSPKFNISVLEPNSEDFTMGHPGMKYVRWLCLFRTILFLGNKFMDKASELTDIPLLAGGEFVGFNLSEDQQVICERFEGLYRLKTSKKLPGQMKAPKVLKRLEDDREDKYKLPGETSYLTFKIPKAPKKHKGKGKGAKEAKGKGTGKGKK